MGIKQFIAFNIGNDLYATSILNVQEIINQTETVSIPEAPEYFLGVIDFREKVIPVIDLKKRLSLSENDSLENGKILILNLDNMLFGGLVDGIKGVIHIDEKDIRTDMTAFNSEKREYLCGFVKTEDCILKILDFSFILSPGDMMYINYKGVSLNNSTDLPHLCETYFNNQIQNNLARHVQSQEDVKDIMEVMELIQNFIDFIAEGELARAEDILRDIAHYGDGKSLAEVQRITTSLENSLLEFKKLLNPDVKNILTEDMPEAQDKLQWVINKTEEAVSQTIKLVEKNLDIQSDIVKRLDIIDAALKKSESTTDEEREAMEFLRNALEGMNADLMELLLIQEYQDLTGQIIKKVIELTGTLERELGNLVKLFGKNEPVKKDEKLKNQDDLDQLLSEFGL